MSRRNTFFIPQTAPFSPADLSNLKVWLKSDIGVTLVGAKVSVWADQSGNGNNVIQATDSLRPTYISNQLNGFGTIQFDGSNHSMKSAPFALSQPETIFIIYKNPVFKPFGGYVFDGNLGDTGSYLQYGTSPGMYMYAGTSFFPTGLVGSYFLATVIFNGINSKHQVNNVAQQVGDTGSANMGGLTLGTYAGGGGYNGNPHIAEVIVMGSEATTTERNNMKTYVTSRYGIIM